MLNTFCYVAPGLEFEYFCPLVPQKNAMVKQQESANKRNLYLKLEAQYPFKIHECNDLAVMYNHWDFPGKKCNSGA